jgi:hypothetical protein
MTSSNKVAANDIFKKTLIVTRLTFSVFLLFQMTSSNKAAANCFQKIFRLSCPTYKNNKKKAKIYVWSLASSSILVSKI